MLKILLLFVVVTTATLRAAVSPEVKWHPGHYVFVAGAKLTTEVLTLPHFRGVQKIYTWRQFEPEKGRYDFSALKADLALAKQHHRQLVVQFTHKSFAKGVRSVPDYLTGPEYGGGVYVTVKGAFNPVLWNHKVAERLDAVIVALGREFDRDPNLEAVNLPETAPNAYLDKTPQAGVEAYTEQIYFEAIKRQMTTLRRAFPSTVVIQYTNFPPKLLVALTDYEKEIGVGLGGPDVYPREDAVSDPEKGIYRLYAKLAGTVPMGAAVQHENYAPAYKKRSAMSRGQTMMNGKPLVITPEDEIPIPVREHLKLAQEKLKLNYLFWADNPKKDFANVKKLLAEPDLANDPAGGLDAKLPPKAFLR
ncbi:MAG: hypothetical protein JNK23_03985 [Opitutaceae bacterium]|nr:hypothetical protein [Opitutaceae bacterium]